MKGLILFVFLFAACGVGGKDEIKLMDALNGKDGADGKAGMSGHSGPQGRQGAVGPTGAEGGDGPQGQQGVEGPAGTQGPTGPQGPTPDEFSFWICVCIDSETKPHWESREVTLEEFYLNYWEKNDKEWKRGKCK